jgi:hypothetical protein
VDVDIEALLMIARYEAACRWPDEPVSAADMTDYPEGLDLHHWADLEWLERVVEDDAAIG